MKTVLVTGFPGFLGSEIVPRVLAREDGSEVVCLIQAKFAPLAKRRAAEIEGRARSWVGRLRLVEGDITVPGLGLEGATEAALATTTTEIFHFAAVYDLSVPRALAVKVNVDGTRHLLDFAERCPKLERVQYVSTCYVSGRYAGLFREEDLVKGQTFNNFYEETKYLAEVDMQGRMAKGLPGTIYRPAIVVGDSKTGVTQKFDGPYFAIRWILKQPAIAVMPTVGDTHRTRLNLVPSDFITEAIDYLSRTETAIGKVYQLADPEPLTIAEVLTAIAKATNRLLVRVPLPLTVAKGAIEHVPGVYALMGIPASAIDYFVHPTYYGTSNSATDLAAGGIRVPPLRDYLSTLVSFLKAHPEIGSEAMV